MKLLSWLAFLLAAAGTVAWISWSARGEEIAVRPDAGARAASAEEPAMLRAPAPGREGVPDSADSDGVSAGAADPLDPAALEMANALWISGRVLLPAGSNPQERLRVTAVGKAFRHRGPYGTEVGIDGRFRVAVAQGSTHVYMGLQGSCLYFTGQRFAVPEPGGELVLEPLVGGRVTGVVVPPPGIPGAAERLARAHVSLRKEATGAGDGAPYDQSVPLGPELTFEFDVVPAGVPLALALESREFPHLARKLVVAPFQTRSLELQVQAGVRIAGIVQDLYGAPLPDAGVSVESERADGTSEWRSDEESDAAFAFDGLPAGMHTLRVSMEGMKEKRVELGWLADREVLEGVVVQLETGATLAGKVEWGHDLTLVAAGFLSVRDATGAESGGYGWRHDVREGAFRIAGLGPGPYQVLATAADPTEADAEWHGQAEVAEPRQDLVLRLEPGLQVEGLVVDGAGTPIPHARVEWVHQRTRQVQHGVSSDREGCFRIKGLLPEPLDFTVRAGGYAELTASLLVFRGDEPLRIQLARRLGLRGIVLGTDGAPVGGATIRLWSGERQETALSNPSGRFEFPDVPPAGVDLMARHKGKGCSPKIQVDLLPTGTFEDVVLQLQPGSRLTGVIRSSSLGVAGRRLVLDPLEEPTVSDFEGRFTFEQLPAGDYVLRLLAGTSQWHAESAQVVTLAAGRETQVVLERASGLRLSGRVHAAGRPLEDAGVEVSTLKDARSRNQTVTTDASGRFEAMVDRGAECMYAVHHAGLSLRRTVTLPDEASWTVELDLGGAAMRGRVSGPSGGSIAGATVRVRGNPVGGNVLCDADGRFSIELPEGAYVLEPDDERGEGLAGRRTQVRVTRGQVLEDLELRLETTGTLRGRIHRPGGAPAVGAQLHLRDAETGWGVGSSAIADALGSFGIGGRRVPRGTYILLAELGDLVWEGPVQVDGGQRPLSLEMRHGTMLEVLVRDAAGAELDAAVTIRGEETAPRRGSSLQAGQGGKVPRTFGPLLPGTYRISVTGSGGASASTELRLDGESKWTVTLALPE